MDIVKELSENQTILLLVPSIKYNEIVADVAKQLSKKSLCYVTLNKTFDSLREQFKKKKINLKNVVFVDAISETIRKTPKQADGVFFVSSPDALTEMSLVIDKFLNHGFESLVFDSLTNLMIYHKSAHVAKCLQGIINKVKASKTKAVFYALKTKEHKTLVEEAGMFVDKIIDLGEK